MLPEYYEFFLPVKINSGKDALETLGWEMQQMGVKKPIILTDQGIVAAGLLDIFLKAQKGSGLDLSVIYDRVPSDSSIDVVNQVVKIYRQNNCDSLIAIGGGSVIDTAKGVNILISHGKDDLRRLMGVDRLEAVDMRPLVVIPTTSGTGSEATLVAVISDTENGVKLPFVSYKLVPRLAILDPRMTESLPPRLTAATGMDALTHAIEAYTCLQKNPISDAYAWSAIELIRDYLFKAVENGRDRQARLAMANASLMAGIAFSNSMVGAVHAIGHSLGAVAHVHHGTAMAILLPYVMEFNLDKLADLYAKLLLPLAGEDIYLNTPKEQRANKAIDIVRAMNQKLHDQTGMPITLTQAGLKEEQIPEVVHKAINDGAMSTNPIDLTAEQVHDLIRKAM